MPPPVPVLSTFGVLNLPPRPNCSATVVVNGYTVDEPTMVMESRADWACARGAHGADDAGRERRNQDIASHCIGLRL